MVLLLIKLPTHFTIHLGIFLSLRLCSNRAGTTLRKAPIMSSESDVATPSLFCQVAWISRTRKSRAVSTDLLGRAPICLAERRLCSSDRDELCRAIALSYTFPNVFRSAKGCQALGLSCPLSLAS
jgi:hypothetical protein